MKRGVTIASEAATTSGSALNCRIIILMNERPRSADMPPSATTIIIYSLGGSIQDRQTVATPIVVPSVLESRALRILCLPLRKVFRLDRTRLVP